MAGPTTLDRGRAAYLDPGAPTAARVSDLLGRMMLAEKIGQMVQIEVTQVTDTTSGCTSQSGFNLPNPVCEQKIFVDEHAGSILAGGTDIPARAGPATPAWTGPTSTTRCSHTRSATRACTSR
jgi:hypothetical protein